MTDCLKIEKIIQNNIQNILRYVDGGAEVTLLNKSKDDQNLVFWVKIESKDAAILIGQKGANLRALQHIISIISQKNIKKEFGEVRIIIDVNNYRLNRLEFLKKIALINYKKAIQVGHIIVLEPMSAYERRVIHLTLAGKNKVTTRSLGEEPNRRVVIKPSKKNIIK